MCRAGLFEAHRSCLLDPVDIGLRQPLPHRAVEIAEARDEHDRGGNPVGHLNEVARRPLEPLLGIAEEAQVLNLIDAEHERRPVDRPHQAPERLDDLEGAPLARVGVERCHCLHRQVGQLAAVEVLPHAPVDARVAALQIEQRAHDVDVEALAGKLGCGHDLVGQRQHHLGELRLVELGLAQLLERGGVEHALVADQMVGEAGEPALAALVGVVGLLERVDEAAQVIVGVVGDVGRHLRVADVGLAGPMR